MSDCLSEETIKVISKYLPVLEKMPSSKRNDFIKGIIEMREYGIEGFSIFPGGAVDGKECLSISKVAVEQAMESNHDACYPSIHLEERIDNE